MFGEGYWARYVFEDGPVKDIVVLESLADKKIAEEFAQVCVVGLIIETQGTSVIQKDGELVGKTPAQHLGRSGHLFLHDTIVFLLLGGCLKTLPRERSATEIHHHIAQRFKVVATGLLHTEMGVDGGVSCCASEVFVLTVGDVQVRFGIAVFLRKTKVDDIHLVAALANAHEKVVRFDVSMNKGLGVYVFDARYLAVSTHETRMIRADQQEARQS